MSSEDVQNRVAGGVDAPVEKKGKKRFKFNTPYAAIKTKQEFMEMSFEEIQKLKERMGTKLVNSALSSKISTKPKEFENAFRHRPKEESSKKRVRQRPKIVIGRIKKTEVVSRDPRFDDLSGTFNEDLFKQSYAFVDEIRANEKKELEKQLAEAEDPRQSKRIKRVILKITTKEKQEEKKAKDKKFKSELKKEQIASIREGKQPYFMKKSDKKTLDLVEMFEDLKKNGKLEQYLAKKRQRNASMLRKKLPN